MLVALVGRTAGHDAMVHPRPLNPIDASVVPAADQKGYGFKGLEPIAAPTVPLVVNSPYLQIWSPRGNLTEHTTVAGDAWGRNWAKELGGLIRVDGRTERFLGAKGAVNAAVQTDLTIFPTRTVYTFTVGGKVRLVLTWTTAVLPQNITLTSRAVTYVTFAVSSFDGNAHDVAVYFDATGQLVTLPANSCVHPPPPGGGAGCRRPGPQPVDFHVQQGLGKMWMRGSSPISCSSGYVNASEWSPDECPDSSDWGQLYLATGASARVTAGPAEAMRAAFAAGSRLPAPATPPILATDLPAVAAGFNLSVSGTSSATQTLVLAYDTGVAIRWFGKDLLPLWTQYHSSAAAMARAALDEQASVRAAAEAFDKIEVAKYNRLGGAKFATLLSLAYRQTYASTELVWNSEANTHWMFLKEMSDNDLSTMDVIFPASPLFIYANPELAYSLLIPILELSSNGTDLPTCPHDLGTFPIGFLFPHRTAGESMPLEETANMLLMLTAIAQRRGKGVGFIAARFWPLLRTWADYLVTTAEDPATQACSDDFMGDLAHNTNLALKGQLAIGAYGQLLAMAGDNDAAKNYTAVAKTYAAYFLKHADDGNHTRLAYDQPNTWSTKYNLIWDRILGLSLFPPELARQEVAFYSTKMEKFGLRLDERKDITKTDWFMWSGALDDSAHGTYSSLVVDKVFAMLEADESGVPVNDCYNTTTGQAYWGDRACVGGFWAKVLAQP